MSDIFSKQKGRVVVVDSSGPVRQLMTDVVRGLGFDDVQVRPSIAETLQYLEAESADWLLLPLMADQPVNALHALKICSEVPQLKKMRVSLLLAEDERYVIPTAFELGALSWHPKPFTKETLAAELGGVLAALSGNEFNEVIAAAGYLRKHLQAEKNWAAQLDLERTLLELYPGNSSILFNMVEPQFNLDRKEQARNTLEQAKLINPNLAAKAEELAKKLFPEGLPGGAAGGGGVNILGIKSCVLIDSDDTVRKAVEEILQSIGITDIKSFGNGEEAWTVVEAGGEPELIIMEWRVPKLTGPLLVQKIRQKFSAAPVVILSSLLKPTDMPLVREMGVANILSKPLHRDIFLPGLIYTVQQERMPTEHQAVERKIRQCFTSGKTEEAERLKAQYLAAGNIPLGRKRQVEAEAAFYTNNLQMARDAGIESLKLAGDSIIILNLLGKTFMRLADYPSALKCFKKAQDLAPNNIERLCNMAEVQTELGDAKAADEALDGAKALDPDNKAVAEAEVKIAIANGDVHAAKSVMSEMDSLGGIVAYMNNKAVAHSKCGLVAEAMEMYRNTMKSIPDEQQDIRVIVQYNLALGLVKAGDFPGAKIELDQILVHNQSKVWAKAKSLSQRLQSAMEKGSELQLRQVPAADAAKNGAAPGPSPAAGAPAASAADGAGSAAKLSTEEEHAQMIAMVEARRGDLCCYLIYNHPGGRDTRASSLLAKQPRFQHRDAVEREEAMGNERVNKAS
jgi:CheY-like chemotaxis protein